MNKFKSLILLSFLCVGSQVGFSGEGAEVECYGFADGNSGIPEGSCFGKEQIESAENCYSSAYASFSKQYDEKYKISENLVQKTLAAMDGVGYEYRDAIDDFIFGQREKMFFLWKECNNLWAEFYADLTERGEEHALQVLQNKFSNIMNAKDEQNEGLNDILVNLAQLSSLAQVSQSLQVDTFEKEQSQTMESEMDYDLFHKQLNEKNSEVKRLKQMIRDSTGGENYVVEWIINKFSFRSDRKIYELKAQVVQQKEAINVVQGDDKEAESFIDKSCEDMLATLNIEIAELQKLAISAPKAVVLDKDIKPIWNRYTKRLIPLENEYQKVQEEVVVFSRGYTWAHRKIHETQQFYVADQQELILNDDYKQEDKFYDFVIKKDKKPLLQAVKLGLNENIKVLEKRNKQMIKLKELALQVRNKQPVDPLLQEQINDPLDAELDIFVENLMEFNKHFESLERKIGNSQGVLQSEIQNKMKQINDSILKHSSVFAAEIKRLVGAFLEVTRKEEKEALLQEIQVNEDKVVKIKNKALGEMQAILDSRIAEAIAKHAAQ